MSILKSFNHPKSEKKSSSVKKKSGNPQINSVWTRKLCCLILASLFTSVYCSEENQMKGNDVALTLCSDRQRDLKTLAISPTIIVQTFVVPEPFL